MRYVNAIYEQYVSLEIVLSEIIDMMLRIEGTMDCDDYHIH